MRRRPRSLAWVFLRLALLSLFPTLAWADPVLSDVQTLAQQEFDETAAYHGREGVKEACGVTVSYSGDAEHFDVPTWAEYRDPRDGDKPTDPERIERERNKSALRRLNATCAQALDALEGLCRSEWKELVAREVKEVRCLLIGHLPLKPHELPSSHVRRNVSFKDGVVTFHAAPNLTNVSGNVAAVLIRSLQHLPGTPVKVVSNGETGEDCSNSNECESALCRNRVCTPCGPKAACGAGLTCYVSLCRTKEYMIGLTRGAGLEAPKAKCLESGSRSLSSRPCCSGKLQRLREHGMNHDFCQ